MSQVRMDQSLSKKERKQRVDNVIKVGSYCHIFIGYKFIIV